jgi:hypothetical protein
MAFIPLHQVATLGSGVYRQFIRPQGRLTFELVVSMSARVPVRRDVLERRTRSAPDILSHCLQHMAFSGPPTFFLQR